ncbi:NERD domain-containing protein [Clostridium sp.]|uniref:NERD domain-containing protein n=1 Tax=Clostridium sp. TaxID=1506 RepID=UPI003F2EF3D1
MLNRIIKVVTNKPTTITKPKFTKEFNQTNNQIEELEKLLQNASSSSRSYIENDIKKLKYGAIGENNIYYELKNSFIPMVCLHDIRIEYKGQVAQIDFIAITTKQIYVIECKNLIGDITITKDGDFIRNKKNTYGKVVSKEGMYSPIVQNERHINILKELLKDKLEYKYKLKRIESLVVTANPKTIINKKQAPKEISNKIIRHDQLINLISAVEKDKKIDWVFIEEDMMNISKCLKEHHKEIEIDYIRKYSLQDTVVENDINNSCNEEMRTNLKAYRLNKSKEENTKAYMIFSNETMEEIIDKKPKNIDELQMIKGFGPVKSEKYGQDILNNIWNMECI